jgi:hypothetical protein
MFNLNYEGLRLMKVTPDILTWIKNDYAPLVYSQPDATLIQNINQVIYYFNTHSGHRILEMFPATSTGSSSSTVIQLTPEFKTVTEVLPSAQQVAIALADPTWTLLGVQVMNYMSADLIAINEGYKNYLAYLGNDFRWSFEPSQDPTTGGILFIQSLPAPAVKVAVIGTKRILQGEDITSEHVLDWILRASITYCKMKEGNILRKATSINVKNDGQEMLNENTEVWESMKKELQANSRWVALSTRI